MQSEGMTSVIAASINVIFQDAIGHFFKGYINTRSTHVSA